MATIESFTFRESNQKLKTIALVHEESNKKSKFETTIITGKNGSYKSTLLKQLVTSLLPQSQNQLASDLFDSHLNPDRHQVFCISGSPADRFPQKQIPRKLRSQFDIPQYTYVGQRVMNNLLSRKAPLETMLTSALAPKAVERYNRNFFAAVHELVSIKPSVVYTIRLRGSVASRDLKAISNDLHGELSRITPEDDDLGGSRHRSLDLSYSMAQWILKEYSVDDFTILQDLITRGAKRYLVTLDATGAHCEEVSTNILRLALLLDIANLEGAEVTSIHSGLKYSALELSSGEYHIFSTILALGFGLAAQSVLLIDEPENNLHPQWQRELMELVFEICTQVMSDGHAIICTHSPVIVGSALEGSSLVDLSNDEPQVHIASYGASTDELLLAQFGIGSTRNRVVVDTVQQAVSYVERGDFENPNFEALVPQLRHIRNALTLEDPMVVIIDALINEESMK